MSELRLNTWNITPTLYIAEYTSALYIAAKPHPSNYHITVQNNRDNQNPRDSDIFQEIQRY